jgi:hypothetical protein
MRKKQKCWMNWELSDMADSNTGKSEELKDERVAWTDLFVRA